MLIKEFVEGFENARDKGNYVNKHISTFYLPFEKKVSLAQSIVNSSSYKIINKSKTYVKDSTLKYVLMMLTLVQNYTDIELSEDAKLNDFDALERIGFFEVLVESLSVEYERFKTVLLMVSEDIESIELNLVSYIERKLSMFMTLSKDIDVSRIKDVIENVTRDKG